MGKSGLCISEGGLCASAVIEEWWFLCFVSAVIEEGWFLCFVSVVIEEGWFVWFVSVVIVVCMVCFSCD